MDFYHRLRFFYIIAGQLIHMTRKIIGYYNGARNESDTDQLILEIGSQQVCCMIKAAGSQQLEGFEVFGVDKNTGDWSDIFYELQSASQILGRQYRDTNCYYNFEESLIIPVEKFNTAAAEDYLSLIFGESNFYDIKHDTLLSGDMVNAYRIRKSVHELLGRHFVLYKPHHSCSKLLDDLRLREQMPAEFVKIQFYSNHFLLLFIKEKNLQLLRAFSYQSDDDILYHVLNVTQQFDINKNESQLEISGVFDTASVLHQHFGKLFSQVLFDNIPSDTELASALAAYPAHYFTPFYKLAV